MRRNLIVLPSNHLRIQALHAICFERRLKSNNFVNYTAHRPNITSVIVGHVFPDFGRCIVRRSGLRSEHATLGHLADIKISNLEHLVFGHEEIGTLDVTMADL